MKGEGDDFMFQWMTSAVGRRLERARATLVDREWLVMDAPR